MEGIKGLSTKIAGTTEWQREVTLTEAVLELVRSEISRVFFLSAKSASAIRVTIAEETVNEKMANRA